MASSIPSQERAVDPFASYDSNSVNRLSEMLSKGQNCVLSSTDLQVTLNDTTSVIVSTGYAIQDSVLVHITSQHTVNFYDLDHYTTVDPYPEPGYNYVVLKYSYQKARPSPTASIKILRPSERGILASSNNVQLLKVVKLTTTGPHTIDSLYDYDPENTSNKRTTASRYGTGEAYLPTFTATRDTSRIAFDNSTDMFYFGISDKWLSLNGSTSIIKDTSALAKGDLVYINSSGNPVKAISKFPIMTSDGVVSQVGSLTSTPQGRVQTAGRVEDVPVESAVSGGLTTGDLLYLSTSEAGKVTNVEDYPFTQFVGRCLDVIDSTTVNILYVRGFVSPSVAAANLAAGINVELDSSSWLSTLDGTSVVYYQDITITELSGKDAIVSVRDMADNEIIEPYDVKFISSTTTRIYMPDSTSSLAITLIGGAINIGTDTVVVVRETLAAGSWTLSGGLYYQDVDISSIGDQDVAVGVRDELTDKKIDPSAIELDSTSTVRVWMNDNTSDLVVTAIGTKYSTDLVGLITEAIETTDWIASGDRYYYDISTSIIENQDVLVSARDDNTDMKIRLDDVEFVDSNTVRVWMPDNTHNLHVIVAG